MTDWQKIAFDNHCRLACETAHPRFGHRRLESSVTVVITVNSGYE